MQPEIRMVPARAYVLVERKGFGEENGFLLAHDAVMSLYRYVEGNNLQPQMGLRFGSAPDGGTDIPPAEQRYQAGWFVKEGSALPPDDDVKQGTLPGGRTAVFRHLGGYETLGETWGNIFGAWLPASGLTPSGAQAYEVYVVLDQPDPAHNVTEICIPVL